MIARPNKEKLSQKCAKIKVNQPYANGDTHKEHHEASKVCTRKRFPLTQKSSNMALFLDISGVSSPDGELGKDESPDIITMPLLSTT